MGRTQRIIHPLTLSCLILWRTCFCWIAGCQQGAQGHNNTWWFQISLPDLSLQPAVQCPGLKIHSTFDAKYCIYRGSLGQTRSWAWFASLFGCSHAVWTHTCLCFWSIIRLFVCSMSLKIHIYRSKISLIFIQEMFGKLIEVTEGCEAREGKSVSKSSWKEVKAKSTSPWGGDYS